MGFLVLFSPEGGREAEIWTVLCVFTRQSDGRAEFGALFIDIKYSLGAELGALCY
jgi:hypothetical protein